MKRQYIAATWILIFLVLVGGASAWSPYGDINLRNFYNIVNFLNMNGTGNITTIGNISALCLGMNDTVFCNWADVGAAGVTDLWVNETGDNMTGNLNMINDSNISVLTGWFIGNGSLLTDVVANDIYVNETGDIMTGDLNMSFNDINDVGNLNLSGNITSLSNITAVNFFGNLNASFIQNEFWVNESGDSMTGDLNMTDNNITDIDGIWLTTPFGINMDEIEDPNADVDLSFNPWDLNLTFNTGTFTIQEIGAFSGDVVHIHQHSGNPGPSNLMQLHAEDDDVLPLYINYTGARNLTEWAMNDMRVAWIEESGNFQTVSNITAIYYFGNGTFLTDINDTLVKLIPSCTDGQVAKWNNSASAWECENDDDTGGDPADVWVNETGDTMTGDLNMSFNDINDVGNLNMTGNITTSGNVTADFFFGNGSQLTGVVADDIYVNESGDTMTGDLNMSGNNIIEGLFINSTNFYQNGNLVLDTSDEPNLNVNSSDFWDAFDTPTDIQELMQIPCENITGATSDLCAIVDTKWTLDDTYLNNVSDTLTFNETLLNITIDARDTDTDTFWPIDDIYLNNVSDTLTFNETLLNATIDARDSDTDTVWTIDDTYLNNVSDVLTFNETLVNTTIDARVDGAVTDFWVNTTGDIMTGNLDIRGQLNVTHASGTGLIKTARFQTADSGGTFQLGQGNQIYFLITGNTSSGDFDIVDDTMISRLYIDAAGEIGLGTRVPNSTLHVIGNISQNDDDYHCFGNSCDGYIGWNNTGGWLEIGGT